MGELFKHAAKDQILIVRYDMPAIWLIYHLVMQHIRPRFAPRLLFKEEELLSKLWSEDSAKIVQDKVEDHNRYKKELRCLFNEEALGRGTAVPLSTFRASPVEWLHGLASFP